jgi:hypothetical protein
MHQICYGFHVIKKCEGRNDPFTVFRTRYSRAPRIIIYDFCCQLMSIVSTGIQVSVLLIYKSNFYCASLIVTSNPVHCQSLIVYVCFRLNSELVPLKLIGCARLRLNAMSIVGFLVISDIVSAPSPSPRIFCLHTILHRPIS